MRTEIRVRRWARLRLVKWTAKYKPERYFGGRTRITREGNKFFKTRTVRANWSEWKGTYGEAISPDDHAADAFRYATAHIKLQTDPNNFLFSTRWSYIPTVTNP